MVLDLIPGWQKSFQLYSGKSKFCDHRDDHKNELYCRIVLLDNTDLELTTEKHATGADIFGKVCKHLNLIERDYFGLCYNKKSPYSKDWLQLDKPISRQLRSDTRVFWFGVKFYPPEPSTLRDDLTRYYLCLQIRNDIISGKLPCSLATHAVLGSYLIQSQFGDYDPKSQGLAEAYLSDFNFPPSQTKELSRQIMDCYKSHKGLTSEDAELRYLENAKKLAMYGVDLHEAKDSNNATIFLGICSNGLLVYRGKLRVNRFAWPKILKIAFKRNHFTLKLRSHQLDTHETKVVFKLANDKTAKRLWKTCVEHHTFFRLLAPENPPRKKFLRFGSSRYRFSGRTQVQSQLMSDSMDKALFSGRRSMSGPLSRHSMEFDSGQRMDFVTNDTKSRPKSTIVHSSTAVDKREMTNNEPAQSDKIVQVEMSDNDRNGASKTDLESRYTGTTATSFPCELTSTSSLEHVCPKDAAPGGGMGEKDPETLILNSIRTSLTDDAIHRIYLKRKERFEENTKRMMRNHDPHPPLDLNNSCSSTSTRYSMLVFEGTPKRMNATNCLQGAAAPLTPLYKTSTPTKLTVCTSPNYLHTSGDSELNEKSTVSTNVNHRAEHSPAYSSNAMASSGSKSSDHKSPAVMLSEEQENCVDGKVEEQKRQSPASRLRNRAFFPEVDHDEELKAAILEATKVNLNMKVERIELLRKP